MTSAREGGRELARPTVADELPRSRTARTAEPRDRRGHPRDARGSTVLIVDDDDDNRVLAGMALEAEGYQVVLASGGASAVVAFEAENPDCVLLDVRMPGVDGFTVCKQIRRLPQGADTPVIFLTGLRDVETFDRALEAGGDDFLTKPIASGELLVRVQSALKLRRIKVELREHYELLKHQRDTLRRVQLQKERLTAFLVHDLKNPVAAIDLHAQVLLRDERLPPDLRDSAAQIRIDTQYLTRMIMNLLDLSKADEGKLSPRVAPVDVRVLIGEIASELAVIASRNGVVIHHSTVSEPIRADGDLLRRALTNLVENALRHAAPASSVWLTAATSADGTEFRVADSGPGVPSEMRERIFDPFVQLEDGSAPASRSGRGLGLAFCRLAAEAHGGRVWVEDASPGAVFCLRLPRVALGAAGAPDRTGLA